MTVYNVEISDGTTSVLQGVFASEELAKAYIKERKANRDKRDRGLEFNIIPWSVTATLDTPSLDHPMPDIEDLVDGPRYALVTTDRDQLDIFTTFYLTERQAEEAMFKDIENTTGHTRKTFMEADEDECGHTMNGTYVASAYVNDSNTTYQWNIVRIPTGKEFKEQK